MAVFSVNQVRQLYVVNAVKSAATELKTPGDAYVVSSDKTGGLYFQYVGALGDTMRSDLIKVDYIKNANIVASEDMAYKLKYQDVVLDTTVNGGAPVAGQDYLLRVNFREYVGISPEYQTNRYGMVHAVSGMVASDFYKQMAISLAKNLSNDVNPLAKVYVKASPSNKEVTSETTMDDLTSVTATGIRIEEVGQPWHLGVMEQGVIPFEVLTPSILVDGDQRLWGTVTDGVSDTVLPQGQKIADLEWFAMGERGDQYRLIGWPNVIPTKYMVDSAKNYDVLTVHYYFEGHNEAVQKSEKDIQIALVNDGSHTLAKSFITAYNTAIQAVDPNSTAVIDVADTPFE